MSREKIYVPMLKMSTLQGRKDCDIFFVNLSGDYSKLCGEALERNITLTSISMKEYMRVMAKRKGVADSE